MPTEMRRKASARAFASSALGPPLDWVMRLVTDQDCFRGFHDGAHLLHRGGGSFGDGFCDRGVHFGVGGGRRKIGFDDGEFFCFFVGEVGAIALGELIDRLFALLDESLEELDRFIFVERANFFGLFVLDGRLDAAKDAEAEFVLGLHCVDEVFLDFFGESHRIL
jgi:hypothetical protein